jgi:lysophospholipase L1-like esterase
MRAEVAIASIIVLAGILASGQAVKQGLEDPPPSPKVVDPATTRCADAYEPVAGGTRRLDIAVVGDLVTSWTPPDDPATSWATYVTGNGVRLTRSWVDRDAEVSDLAAQVRPSDADVLVVLAGTNDLDHGSPGDEVELGLTHLVAAAGVEHVLISSIPPVEDLPQKTADFNELLARIAYRHDWSFVDAGSAVVRADCRYRTRLSPDGIRPSPEGARIIGEAVRGVLTSRAEFAAPPAR